MANEWLDQVTETDLFAATDPDGSTTYKVTGAQFKSLFSTPKPWVGHDGGIWHVKNAPAGVKLASGHGPYTAWDIDGTSKGEISAIQPLEEVVFVTGRDPYELFADNRGTWDFGEETDTSKVTDFYGLFNFSLKFNGTLGGNWDTSNVTDMTSTFEGAQAFNQDISNWDTGNVTDMSYMFEETNAFNADLSNWDTSNVTSMIYMFRIGTAFNQDISGWDVSNVTSMQGMFSNASSFNQDLSNWCVTLITDKPDVFDANATSWTEPKPCWGHCPPKGDPCPPKPWEGHAGGIWHIQNVRNMPLQLDLGWGAPGFDYPQSPSRGHFVYEMDGTLLGKLKEIPIGLECVIVTPPDSSGLFGNYHWPSFSNPYTTEFDFGPLTDTSKVTIMRALLEEIKGSPKGMENWDVSNVVDKFPLYPGSSQDADGMQSLLKNANEFNGDLSGWCVTNIKTRPSEFSTNLPVDKEPQWGTCPRGEDVTS